MNNKSISKHVLLFWLLSFGAMADEAVEDELLSLYGSEEFISIATGYKQPITKAPAVASIITSEQIKKMGATDIDDVLETVPGLHVSVNQQGYLPIYTFRGINTGFNPQVLFLVNGVPQTNLFTGGKHFVWGGFPVEAIDRIEVIRGPGSAIYGADAFAGVINIITRAGKSYQGLEMGVRGGEPDYKSIFINYGKRQDTFDWGVFIEHSTSDRNKETIASDAQTLLDTSFGTDSSLAPSSLNLGIESTDIRLSMDSSSLSLNMGYQGRRKGENGVGIAQALDPVNRYASDRYSLDFKYVIDDVLPDFSVDIAGSYLNFSQEAENNAVLFPPGTTGPSPLLLGYDANLSPVFFTYEKGVIGSPEVFETHSRLDITSHYEGVENHKITVGFGYYYGDMYKTQEDKNYCADIASCSYLVANGGSIGGTPVDMADTPYVFLREGARDNYHIYVQDVYRFANDWELTAGVRYDDYSDFGETFNPRFALVWSTTSKLTTKFLYGEAFRAPSFLETRNTNNPAALGNPNLAPETLKSYELVFDYKPVEDFEYVINTFYYEWDDIIQYVPGPGGANVAQNAGRQNGYGAEAEFKWQAFTGFDIQGSFSVQKSTNEETDSDAANSPGKQLFIQANWAFADDWNLNVQGNWVMDRSREASDTRSDIDDYVLFDMSLHRTMGSFEMAVHVNNLLNEDAREPSPNGVPVALIPYDLPLPGRQLVGEIRYKF